MIESVFSTAAARNVIEKVYADDVRYVRLCFVDPLGLAKGQNISRDLLWDVLERGQGFDGSSIEGFSRIEESDKVALPYPETFRILPYDVAGEKVGIMFCRVMNPGGTRFEGDSFLILENALEQARADGFSHFYVGPELEFFYLKAEALKRGETQLVHTGGYFDEGTTHAGAIARMKSVEALRQLGIDVEGDHGEVADSQNEIDLLYKDALTMAWSATLYRVVVKEIAAHQGFAATFMPKPIAGVNGSGMHVHQSLFRDGTNAFFQKDDPYHLSKTARQYMAGIFKYLPEAMLIMCQWVNSYKRLVPGYEAPVYLCWGRRNRSALIRVPEYQKGREKATRIELRCPDPGCNIPLAFAVMLQMGLRGIREGLDGELPKAVETDVFHLSDDDRRRQNISTLPASFDEALKLFRTSQFMVEILGSHLHERICKSKEDEWERYLRAVGDKADDRTVVSAEEVKLYTQYM